MKDHEERDKYGQLKKYQPLRDDRGAVVEEAANYVRRMQSTVLPRWPEEVLCEWIHRHADDVEKYDFLDFESFSFEKEVWPLDRIPGGEAFDDEGFCDAFSNVEVRAEYPHDWLAIYMVNNGTWNTPIVLLDNAEGKYRFPLGEPLRQPFHLLEGHRRLSFLNGLRQRGKSNAEHHIWVVRKFDG